MPNDPPPAPRPTTHCSWGGLWVGQQGWWMDNGQQMRDAQTCHINAGTNDKAPTSSSVSDCLQGGLGGAKMQTGMMMMADRDDRQG
jgi:hypothetical protein